MEWSIENSIRINKCSSIAKSMSSIRLRGNSSHNGQGRGKAGGFSFSLTLWRKGRSVRREREGGGGGCTIRFHCICSQLKDKCSNRNLYSAIEKSQRRQLLKTLQSSGGGGGFGGSRLRRRQRARVHRALHPPAGLAAPELPLCSHFPDRKCRQTLTSS